MSDLILYQFSRDRVEAGDATDFLSRFNRCSLPTGKKLEVMMNGMALMIDGYNHDHREIYAIPEVRAFYKQLWKGWPYWLFFCNLDSENLMMMVMW
jgi:hypothetical protein